MNKRAFADICGMPRVPSPPSHLCYTTEIPESPPGSPTSMFQSHHNSTPLSSLPSHLLNRSIDVPHSRHDASDIWKEILISCRNLINSSSKAINESSFSHEDVNLTKINSDNISQLVSILCEISANVRETSPPQYSQICESQQESSLSKPFSPNHYPSWRKHPNFPCEAKLQSEGKLNEGKEVRKCHFCVTTMTPEWRKGPDGPKT
eukprot:TRINITY_DN6032_c0_g1_i2.p1 TRINITY_DN6032_c0_g1~~TRINITY_DN6032_c0_g1_i2.p1  ORF type:complete len:223 (-),score=27.17 TRINITY_DN6032_c0_g1_i2:76-693(-)